MDVAVLIPTLGTVIVAALGFWLQDRRARGEAAERAETAEREATERRETAERDAEEARRSHLFDERRGAYLALATDAAAWIDKIGRVATRPPGDNVFSSQIGADDNLRVAVARAAGIARLVAPGYVRDAVDSLVRSLTLYDATVKEHREISEGEVIVLESQFAELLEAMQEDLTGVGTRRDRKPRFSVSGPY